MSFRGEFVAGFRSAARGGLQVGAGQSGVAQNLPAGIPDRVAEQLRRLAAEVFHHAFIRAMRPTLALPIAVMLLAAVSCLLVRRYRRPLPVAGPQVPTGQAAPGPVAGS